VTYKEIKKRKTCVEKVKEDSLEKDKNYTLTKCASPESTWPSRCQKNICFSLSFYASSFLKVHLHHSLKIKSHKEVTKQKKSRFFLIFLLVDGRIRIQSQTNKLRTQIRIQEARKHAEPDLDADPEHCFFVPVVQTYSSWLTEVT
jgi:hypothetical protein